MALLPQLVVACVVVFALPGRFGVKSESGCDLDVENALRTLLSPEQNSMQVQALRRDLLRKFQEALDRLEEEEAEQKRSLSSLAAWNNLPEHKRNLQALARSGYLQTLPDEEDGIESLARNGDLHRKKDIQEQIDEFYEKKSLSSLAKSGDLGYQRAQYKRNIASLAREGKFTGKRSVSEDEYSASLHKLPETASGVEDKRNLPSIKAQYKPTKFKRSTGGSGRDADYFEEDENSPFYKYPSLYDYEDWMQDLTAAYPNAEKRFLGSVARTGWFRPSSSRYSRFVQPEKRHIGSLARLGWLPSFRNVRRFNRSGRSSSQSDKCRLLTVVDVRRGRVEIRSIFTYNYQVGCENRPLSEGVTTLREVSRNTKQRSARYWCRNACLLLIVKCTVLESPK
ncbi:hypothetical protein NQ315_001822 [Exocentrus adspersus]|uniref:Neuropeptide-like 1 n=1 Tax=Exocentrus adspersus TaxID=1586481 RepID=A0AAV8WAL1_9CUCU|nr:hypothetical protein NQ315_001822 [Exocentrus adspersus]